MRALASKALWVWPVLPFLLGVSLVLGSCRVAEPRGFFSDLSRTDAELRAFPLDDILVWPVFSKEPRLAGVLDRMTRELHQGLLKAQYSVLSHSKATELAQSLGTAQESDNRNSALEALRRLKGDGVLIVTLDSWNEGGLESLGKVECEGRFWLLSPQGTVLWQGRFRNNGKVVEPFFESHDLDDLRVEAVKNLAGKLSRKFPPHRVL